MLPLINLTNGTETPMVGEKRLLCRNYGTLQIQFEQLFDKILE